MRPQSTFLPVVPKSLCRQSTMAQTVRKKKGTVHNTTMPAVLRSKGILYLVPQESANFYDSQFRDSRAHGFIGFIEFIGFIGLANGLALTGYPFAASNSINATNTTNKPRSFSRIAIFEPSIKLHFDPISSQ